MSTNCRFGPEKCLPQKEHVTDLPDEGAPQSPAAAAATRLCQSCNSDATAQPSSNASYTIH